MLCKPQSSPKCIIWADSRFMLRPLPTLTCNPTVTVLPLYHWPSPLAKVLEDNNSFHSHIITITKLRLLYLCRRELGKRGPEGGSKLHCKLVSESEFRFGHLLTTPPQVERSLGTFCPAREERRGEPSEGNVSHLSDSFKNI